jgi:hypothetical protein
MRATTGCLPRAYWSGEYRTAVRTCWNCGALLAGRRGADRLRLPQDRLPDADRAGRPVRQVPGGADPGRGGSPGALAIPEKLGRGGSCPGKSTFEMYVPGGSGLPDDQEGFSLREGEE